MSDTEPEATLQRVRVIPCPGYESVIIYADRIEMDDRIMEGVEYRCLKLFRGARVIAVFHGWVAYWMYASEG